MTTAAQRIAFSNARHTKACNRVADQHGLTGLARQIFVFTCEAMPTFETIMRQFQVGGEAAIAVAELVSAGLVRVQTMGQTVRYIPIRVD